MGTRRAGKSPCIGLVTSIRSWWGGDPLPLLEWQEDQRPRIRRWLCARGFDTIRADEILLEIEESAVAAASSGRAIDDESSWLKTILRHKLADRARLQRPREAGLDEPDSMVSAKASDPSVLAERADEERQCLAHLAECIARMHDPYRIAADLVLLRGVSYHEAHSALDAWSRSTRNRPLSFWTSRSIIRMSLRLARPVLTDRLEPRTHSQHGLRKKSAPPPPQRP